MTTRRSTVGNSYINSGSEEDRARAPSTAGQRQRLSRIGRCLVWLAGLFILCEPCWGGEPAGQVKLLEAAGDGRLKVAVIATGHSRLILLLENMESQPLAIAPQVLAAVPASRISRQHGGSESSTDALAPSTPRTPQSLATVFSDQYAKLGLRRHPGKQTPAAFVIPGNAKRRLELPCFCMEHGNPDPSTRIAYQLWPVAELKPKPPTEQLLQQYLSGAIPQRPLQLAIWHLENDVSWRELSQLSHRNTPRASRYSAGELRQAGSIVQSLRESERRP